jgi:citrate lyase subunit gamma (acyl carrier protein)
MVCINKTGMAGTVESNDVMIMISPALASAGITINVQSPVKKQYGKKIEAAVREVLTRRGIQDVVVEVNDRGALDCTIYARVDTAIDRAMA